MVVAAVHQPKLNSYLSVASGEAGVHDTRGEAGELLGDEERTLDRSYRALPTPGDRRSAEGLRRHEMSLHVGALGGTERSRTFWVLPFPRNIPGGYPAFARHITG
mgnify:CR=1 FL=1